MDLTSFRMTSRRLANGVRLLVVENPRLPLVSLSVLVLVGADCNPPGHPGLSALTGRMLDEGTLESTAREIAIRVENSGGNLSTFSDRQMTGIAATFVREHLGTGIELLSEMIRRPRFDPNRFSKEKQKTLSYLESIRDDPDILAANLLYGSVYRGTPLQYPINGTPEAVEGLGVSDAVGFHSANYGPENTLLVVAGDVAEGQVRDLASQHLGDWAEPNRHRNGFPRLDRQREADIIRSVLNKRQVHLRLGHLGVARGNRDFQALQVLDVALGSGPGFVSRVPRRLRDELGLVYNATCDITGSSGIHPGVFQASLSTSPGRIGQATEELIAILDDVRRNGICKDELRLSQDYLTGSFVFDFQSNADLARFLVSVELFGLGLDFAERYPAEIHAVTLEDVRRVARKYLDTLHYTTVVVGPAEKTAEP